MAFSLDLGNLLVHLRLRDHALSETESALKKMEMSLRDFGTRMSMRVTVPLLAMGTAMVKNSMSLESAFAGVRKTVDATEEQFAVLKAGFDGMAKSIPLSVREIYGIGEAAGQLGISLPNLLKFTETMAALGATTNMTSQDAAMSLARFTNIMQMPEQSVDRLGSTIVELGNNLATTEREITEMAVRMAGAGNIVGMAESDVLALAAALSSVGMEAEAGGTAVNRILLDMYNSVQSGNKELKIFALVAGQSIEQFSKSFREDAVGAFTSFVEGLGRLHQSGANVQQVLEAVGMDNVRVTRALLSAASAGDLLRSSVEMGSRAWKENTALVEEANKRYATQESRLRALWNRVSLAAESMGNIIAGRLLDFTSKVIDPIVQGFQELSPNTQQFIVDLSVLAALAGPVALGFAAIIKTILVMKAAMLVTVTAATLLQTTLAGVFVAIASYKMGRYLYDEFESVAVAATKVAGALLLSWEKIKHVMDQGIVYLKMGWSKFKVWLMNLVADMALSFSELIQHMESFASDMAGRFVDMGSVTMNQLANKMRREAKAVSVSFQKELDDNKKLYEQMVEGIESATIAGVEEVHKRFAGTGDNAKQAQAAADALKAQAEGVNKLTGGLKTNNDLLKSLNEALGMTADQVEAYRSILSELGPVTKEAYEFQKRHIEAIAEGYRDQGISQELVTLWLQRQNDLLDIAAGKVGNMANQLRAAAKEIQMQAEEAGGPWYQFAVNLPSMLESGFMRAVRAGREWKDQMKALLEELYWEAVRLSVIKPLAEGMAGMFSSVGSAILGSFSGGQSSVPVTPGMEMGQLSAAGGMAEGGIAWHPTIAALAEKGRPELVTPLDQVKGLGLGGKVTVNVINESGVPLDVSRQEQYTMSDERIIDVVVSRSQTDSRLQRALGTRR
jgi:TP901 family phage tail tape measure protein